MNDNWYIEVNGQLYGPYDTLQIIQMLQNNQIVLNTLVKSATNGITYKVQDIIAPQQPIVNPASFPPPIQNQPFSGTGTPQYNGPQTYQTPQNQYTQHPIYNQVPPIQPIYQAQPNQNIPKLRPIQVVPPSTNLQKTEKTVGVTNNPNTNNSQQANSKDKTSPTVKPVMVTPISAPQQQTNSNQQVNLSSSKLNNTLRNWIDRTNIENGKIVCPHCWGLCSLETILFISEHPELVGDPLLGEAPTRFLPKYFTAKGTAFDERGMECSDMACPHCHLKIPNAVIDLPSSFFSIVGAPASGKSYFLTSMLWQLRKSLPMYFNFSLYDTDPSFNMVLNNYERILFLNSNQQEYVSLPKTELQGRDFSNQIVIENSNIDLPRPFVFTLLPQESHPFYGKKGVSLERSLVLYDNAGKHFEAGRDSVSNLATVHLVHSDGIIFLYDPLKDIRLRKDCSENDPQIARNTATATNQITIFNEMVARIHKFSNLRANEKYNKPLIMVIPKYDAWKDSFPIDIEHLDLIVYDENMSPYLNMDIICMVSFCLRKYLLEVAPEIVGLAEGFSQRVYFIPVSSLGRMPEFDEKKSIIGIKPAHLSPIWAEVPFLLQLHLNDLLQAACLTDETIPYITQYKFQGSHIMFGFPDTNERYTLPSFYCNKTVYCETTKKYYRLPNYPKVETQVEDVNTQEFANQDFWAN